MRIWNDHSNKAYILGSEIGAGSFGTVFFCFDDWNNMLVAKAIRPNGRSFDEVRSRTYTEVAALSTVRHPNIVYIYDAFLFENVFYLILEKCEFELKALIDNAQLDTSNLFLPIAKCVLQAIDFIANNGLVHCDIHSGNVMSQFSRDEITNTLTSGLRFKLSNLGLAKPIGGDLSEGTFLHRIRPPECLDPDQFGTPDHRVDIYQAGLLFLELLTNAPLKFDDDERLAGKPRELALQLPAPYNFAIEKMLRRTVRYRTNSASEAWRDLNSPIEDDKV